MKFDTHMLGPNRVIRRQRELADDVPRIRSRQYNVDLEYERAFACMVANRIPFKTLIDHFLIHERPFRLERIRQFERDFLPSVSEVVTPPRSKARGAHAENSADPGAALHLGI